MADSAAATRCAAFSPVAPVSLASLAEQLRDGPLRILAALQHEATALASRAPGDDHELLEQLQRLVVLSISGMSRFQEFTAGLRQIIDRLATERAERH
jgi:hypothetical protein